MSVGSGLLVASIGVPPDKTRPTGEVVAWAGTKLWVATGVVSGALVAVGTTSVDSESFC